MTLRKSVGLWHICDLVVKDGLLLGSFVYVGVHQILQDGFGSPAPIEPKLAHRKPSAELGLSIEDNWCGANPKSLRKAKFY